MRRYLSGCGVSRFIHRICNKCGDEYKGYYARPRRNCKCGGEYLDQKGSCDY